MTKPNTHKLLAQQARHRYPAGTGPWSKTEDLDQVDLVGFEGFAGCYTFDSDVCGLLSGSIERLVEEVRKLRGWPTPPEGRDE